jgi:molybdopterin-containing oxidoreductase family iron-sulfur binding subunit
MNLSDIRTRLDGLEGRAYWRSLEELADTSAFREYVQREFPAQASEFTDPAGRRQFLKLMGASLALAGVSACTRQPEEDIVPYVRQPEEVIPGRPLFFATAMPIGGLGMPLLAENHLGRPTKLEGNPEHPASLGAADVLAQASVLGLYDPDRSRTIVHRGDVKTWASFTAMLQAAINAQRGLQGQGLRLLTEPTSSPSVIDQIQTLLTDLPAAKWHQWDAVYGVTQGPAPADHATYRFDRADVIVSLDADFLGFGPSAVRYTKDFSSRRRINTPQDELNRLYVVEPVPTITGGKADHRLAVKARDVHGFAEALAGAVGARGAAAPAGGSLPDEARTKWIPALAADLSAHKGRSVVVAGDHQPAPVHALAKAMNEALGNVGTTVQYGAPVVASPADGAASLAELAADIAADKVNLLLILGGNPAFTAPADLKFAEVLRTATTRAQSPLVAIHLGLHHDETAELCTWHVPEAHYLESWGDVRSFDGTISLIQPLVAPLYDGRSAIEVLAVINGMPGQPPMDLLKEYWAKTTGEADINVAWRRALHDGFMAGPPTFLAAAASGSGGSVGSAGSAGSGSARSASSAPSAPSLPAATAVSAVPVLQTGGLEIVFRPDPNVLDGRFANSGWLQEFPKPLSKVTWENVAYLSVRTAARLGVTNGDEIEITYQGRAAKIPAWVMPGAADDAVIVHFGYGRRRAGRVGTGIGADTFVLRSSKAPWFDGGAEVTLTGTRHSLASTQNHFAMEGRHPVRVVDAEDYRKDPKVVAAQGHPTPPKTLSLYPADHPHSEGAAHKWGMAIDLNSCTGCQACIAACIAENNIPVVGKSQVERSREMHWLRVDTYFEGNPEAPGEIVHQPVPCMQCENAPCEVVCPVAATVHSDEGLNDMVYNRCVGTRYCSNNCPYKVRRFNFMLYSDFTTPEIRGQRNPDVTIRSRGVMEKCTYCVQRINQARVDAKTDGRAIRDGEITTACQQTCPADAIVFGDLLDLSSKVVALKNQQRNYGLLEDLGTRPRTTYLAVVRNPNPALA